ncbi:MAG TPA: hypothetical protein VHV49_11020 [Pseudonocardiaceae bacterium]|jgi:hypothetical protein|nr:hypothetical protein [Pseudonocardiaceae bacterium]
MADQATRTGSGFAVRDEALGDYASAAGRIATDLGGFAQRELHTASKLPADAFGSLAHSTGFTTAVVRFCGRVTDLAHECGGTMRDIESGVEQTRRHYRAAEHAVLAHLHAGKGTTA